MKRTTLFLLAAMAVVFFAGRGAAAGNTPANNANTVATAPTAEVLLALDTRANEAYLKGDAKFFEEMLSDKFVMHGTGASRMDKSATTSMIAGLKCDIKDGWKLDEPQLSMIDPDTYVLIYKGTFDGTCTMDGKTQKIPSPIRAATVWVRNGDKWRAAFHGENLIVDPKAPAAPPAKPEAEKESSKKDDKTAPDATPAVPAAADPSTDAMLAIEKSVWEAWKERDAKKLEELTAKDLAFMDIFGIATSTKAETIKLWTGHRCDIESVSLTDATGTLLSDTAGILTHKGTVEGTCYGQKIPPVYGTSVYVKNGDAWKLAFTLNRLPN